MLVGQANQPVPGGSAFVDTVVLSSSNLVRNNKNII